MPSLLTGEPVKSVIVVIPQPILMIKGRPNADHELVFIANKLPPIGYRIYYVEGTNYRLKRRIKKPKTTRKTILQQRLINPLKFDDEIQNDNMDFESVENAKMLNNTINNTNYKVEVDYEYDIFKSTAAPIDDIYVNSSRKKRNETLKRSKREIENIFKPTTIKLKEGIPEVSISIIRDNITTERPADTMKTFKTVKPRNVTNPSSSTTRRQTVVDKVAVKKKVEDMFIANKVSIL